MTHPFPAESVRSEQEVVNTFRTLYPNDYKPLLLAYGIMNHFATHRYGFVHNLRTGIYAHWPHEVSGPPNIPHHNCTTVIAPVFLEAEAFGLHPEIVQFVNFQTKRRNDENQDGTQTGESHFAVKVNVGRKHPFLMDPFWNIFGPILRERDRYMKIGKMGKYESVERYYSYLHRYSPEEFRALMDRMLEPAASLDMLIAGQKVFSQREVEEVKGTIMVYYRERENTLVTRLYLPMEKTLDKAIFCSQELDERGNVQKTTLQFSVARDSSWKSLVEERVMARLDYVTIQRLRRLLGKRRTYARIGPELAKPHNARKREILVGIADTLEAKLEPEEREALEPFILARTLYEAESPQREYLFTNREQDQHLIDLIHQEWKLADKLWKPTQVDYLQRWKLQRYDPAVRSRDKRKIKRLIRQKSKLIEEIDAWNVLRHKHTRLYRRTRDRILFGEALQEKSREDLRRMVTERDLDPRIGYLALVTDFMPYALKARPDLELNLFLADIQQRVAARHALKTEDPSKKEKRVL